MLPPTAPKCWTRRSPAQDASAAGWADASVLFSDASVLFLLRPLLLWYLLRSLLPPTVGLYEGVVMHDGSYEGSLPPTVAATNCRDVRGARTEFSARSLLTPQSHDGPLGCLSVGLSDASLSFKVFIASMASVAYVTAITRPEVLGPALTRPGRLGRMSGLWIHLLLLLHFAQFCSRTEFIGLI